MRPISITLILDYCLNSNKNNRFFYLLFFNKNKRKIEEPFRILLIMYEVNNLYSSNPTGLLNSVWRAIQNLEFHSIPHWPFIQPKN